MLWIWNLFCLVFVSNSCVGRESEQSFLTPLNTSFTVKLTGFLSVIYTYISHPQPPWLGKSHLIVHEEVISCFWSYLLSCVLLVLTSRTISIALNWSSLGFFARGAWKEWNTWYEITFEKSCGDSTARCYNVYFSFFRSAVYLHQIFSLRLTSDPCFDNCCIKLASQCNALIERCRVSKSMQMKTILSASSRSLREPLKMLTGSWIK